MRLNSIKLAGFKSFAEPTNFMLPGQLVGVVGPNGCGKSNIMDAVRWVLGESKASELRGESMQDVIFNGTTSRKPASRSSVELTFDNSDHRAGGQWNQFTEIAVKRVLTRDGTSSYFINNQPVRRRDVQDVFLGTGLGPRAYAIIGQGTISRIIESRPEELRLFLEEAAGVSKYKERRRETENRLSDTRENLTRVEDILRELNANLDKLEKQAEVAARYNALQQDVTLKQHQLWFLKRAEAESEQARVRTEGLAAVNDLESRMADLRHVEADLETIRQAHYEAGDKVNQAQGRLYEATAEVGKLEAEIRYVVEGRQRVEQRLVQLAEQIAQWSARKEEAEAEVEGIEGAGMNAEEQAEILAAQVEEQATRLPELEDALRQSQQRSDEQRAAVAQVQQQIQVLAAEQRSLDEQSRQLEARLERLRTDRNALAAPDEARLANLRQQLQQAEEGAEMAEARLAELQNSVPQLDEDRRARQQVVNQETARQADLSARLEALKALQEKVKVDGKLQPWLAKHGLEGLQGLWSRIHIDPGWENALEAALRERLAALPVGRLDMVRGFLGASGAAGFLQRAICARARNPRWFIALVGSAARARRRAARRARGLAAGLLHRADAGRCAEPPRAVAAGRGHLCGSRPCRVRAQREFLCAGLRAVRPAGPGAGDRTPGEGAACPGLDRRGGAHGAGACREPVRRRGAAPGGRAPRGQRGPRPRA